MAELSSAAQAVLDSTDYPEDWATRIRVAAALRAVAEVDGITPESVGPMPGADPTSVAIALAVKRSQTRAYRTLCAIATELENINV
jgi:hypothetical protein